MDAVHDRCDLSWDGVLCEGCRRFFDSRINALHRDGSGDADPGADQPGDEPLHDIPTLRRCADQGCQLCGLVLFNMNHRPDGRSSSSVTVAKLEESNAKLFARIFKNGAFAPFDADVTLYLGTPPQQQPSVGGLTLNMHFSILSDEFSDESLSGLSGSSTWSYETFKKIKRWLANCRGHSQCREWPSLLGMSGKLPTRLLEIIPSPEALSVRLVSGQTLNLETSPYATLSHCWGGKHLPTKLLKGNIRAFSDAIQWGLLPLTFQEAITAAHRLGLKFMWIDALCIIQDCKDDWRTEAALMAGVYVNCYVNISADASTDGTGGLSRDRDMDTYRRACIIPSSSSRTPGNTQLQRYYCGHVDGWLRDVETAPLRDRAWVHQERFLSPRVIHFSNNEVHWECVHLLTSESVPDELRVQQAMILANDKSTVFGSADVPVAGRHKKLYRLWDEIVGYYSEASLTYASDRQVAFSGLANAMSHLLGLKPGDYLSGHWRPRFVDSLSWVALKGTGRRDASSGSAPSWSWLSVGSWVRPWTKHRSSKNVAELLEAEAVPTHPGDPFGPVLSVSVRIRAPICEVIFAQAPAVIFEHCEHPERCSVVMMAGSHALRQGVSFSLSPDDTSAGGLLDVMGGTCFLLLLSGVMPDNRALVGLDSNRKGLLSENNEHSGSGPGPDLSGNYECLILRPSDPAKVGHFRRVGFIMFDDLNPRTRCGNGVRDAPDCYTILQEAFHDRLLPREQFGDRDEKFMYRVTLV